MLVSGWLGQCFSIFSGLGRYFLPIFLPILGRGLMVR